MPTKKKPAAPMKGADKKKDLKKIEKKEKKPSEAPITETAPVQNEPVPETYVEKEDSLFNLRNMYIIFGIIIVAIAIAILIFSQKEASAPGNNSSATSGASSKKSGTLFDSIVSDGKVKKGDKIKVDYVGKLQDGTIFDSSIEDYAKKMKNYQAGARKYEPLEFTVGEGQMIKGFDEGVVGMKVGEKKTLTIAPKDAYGEEFTTQEVPLKYLQDHIDQEVPVENLKDTITQTYPKELLGDKTKNLKVGDKLDSEGMQGKVVDITASGVTLQIENTQNPFYGKKLTVGATTEYQGNVLTIKKITDTTVTLDILNKQNPFFGKKLIVGLEGKLPNGETVKITNIAEDKVTVQMKNSHELAGKTLIFDIEIKDIAK